jgi:hypothetical protein
MSCLENLLKDRNHYNVFKALVIMFNECFRMLCFDYIHSKSYHVNFQSILEMLSYKHIKFLQRFNAIFNITRWRTKHWLHLLWMFLLMWFLTALLPHALVSNLPSLLSIWYAQMFTQMLHFHWTYKHQIIKKLEPKIWCYYHSTKKSNLTNVKLIRSSFSSTQRFLPFPWSIPQIMHPLEHIFTIFFIDAHKHFKKTMSNKKHHMFM